MTVQSQPAAPFDLDLAILEERKRRKEQEIREQHETIQSHRSDLERQLKFLRDYLGDDIIEGLDFALHTDPREGVYPDPRLEFTVHDETWKIREQHDEYHSYCLLSAPKRRSTRLEFYNPTTARGEFIGAIAELLDAPLIPDPIDEDEPRDPIPPTAAQKAWDLLVTTLLGGTEISSQQVLAAGFIHIVNQLQNGVVTVQP